MSRLLRDSWEFQEEIHKAGRQYDALRGKERRGLFNDQAIEGGIWNVQWTNKVPSAADWGLRGYGHDLRTALEMLLRRLNEEIEALEKQKKVTR